MRPETSTQPSPEPTLSGCPGCQVHPGQHVLHTGFIGEPETPRSMYAPALLTTPGSPRAPQRLGSVSWACPAASSHKSPHFSECTGLPRASRSFLTHIPPTRGPTILQATATDLPTQDSFDSLWTLPPTQGPLLCPALTPFPGFHQCLLKFSLLISASKTANSMVLHPKLLACPLGAPTHCLLAPRGTFVHTVPSTQHTFPQPSHSSSGLS